MGVKLIHNGITYEAEYAVRCDKDKYIKLFDAKYNEIAAFHEISNFSDYTLVGGWTSPCAYYPTPISLSAYAMPGAIINATNWIEGESGYYYDITNALISGNTKTCHVILNFASGTEFEYKAEQTTNQIRLIVDKIPNDLINIESITILRV